MQATIENATKRCSRCRDWKPYDEYTIDRSTTDGRCRYCKSCLYTKVTNVCVRCGAEFKRAMQQQYCSLSCRSIACAKHGEQHPTYKGRVTSGKYVRVWEPGHPLANSDGYVLEHRKVLFDNDVVVPDGYHVHHVNGDPSDNSFSNLAVLTPKEHRAAHRKDRGTPEEIAERKRQYQREWCMKNRDHIRAYRLARRAAGIQRSIA